MISLAAVNITEKTKKLMKEALQKGFIGQGPYIKEFEDRLARFFGVKYVVTTANGTLADAIALSAAKIETSNKKNEVIVPALTFIAQINAVYYNQLKPVFVDVGYDYQIDTEKIKEKINENTLAIMPTHLLGGLAKMEKVLSLAKEYNLFVIEDSCEAFGSRYQNKFCGTIGDMGCFSFYVSHTVTTGEGGMVATNNDSLAESARSLGNHGRKSNKPGEHFLFPHIGFSAKMNVMEAIIGLGVLEELPKYCERRHQNMVALNNLLGKDSFSNRVNEYIVPHVYPIMMKSEEERNQALKILPEKFGIEARQIFYSIPTQSEAYRFLGEKEGAYPVAEDIGRRGLYVPCHHNLGKEELTKIANVLKEVIL